MRISSKASLASCCSPNRRGRHCRNASTRSCGDQHRRDNAGQASPWGDRQPISVQGSAIPERVAWNRHLRRVKSCELRRNGILLDRRRSDSRYSPGCSIVWSLERALLFVARAAVASKRMNAFLRTATLQWYVQRRAQRSECCLSMACPAKSVLNMFLLARTHKTQLAPSKTARAGTRRVRHDVC